MPKTLEIKTTHQELNYIECTRCHKESAIENNNDPTRNTCFNPKCGIYTPPTPIFDVTMDFITYCINNALPGYHKIYLEKILKMTKKAMRLDN